LTSIHGLASLAIGSVNHERDVSFSFTFIGFFRCVRVAAILSVLAYQKRRKRLPKAYDRLRYAGVRSNFSTVIFSQSH